MNPVAKFVAERPRSAWCLAIALAAAIGTLAALQMREVRQQDRLVRLATEVERSTVEIMSKTLNGNLMGAVSVLGLIDEQIKLEALGKLPANNPVVLPKIESIARSYDADGVFIVNEKGIAVSSWDNSGKPSTGLNLKFRPYYQMAMQGMDNVYAAVSLARGDRSLYFAAPVFRETTNGTEAIGAVVARTGLLQVETLLRNKADIALLLSPQGVVFTSSRKEWIGTLAGKPTPERLKAIRELKQFGKMFDEQEPALLPVSIENGLQTIDGKRYAVAKANVQWNDPFGEWTLVILEDLGRTVLVGEAAFVGLGVAALMLLLGVLGLNILRNQYRQDIASEQLAVYAQEQARSAEHQTRIADASVHMQRAKNLADLAHSFLDEAHQLLGALQGVVYVAAANGEHLDLAGSFACAQTPPASIHFGEGLLGQCAIERKRQLITLGEHRATIRSGLGEATACATLLGPVILNETVLGVVELAVLHPLQDHDLRTFDELINRLAMNIEIVGRSEKTEQTLSAALAAEQMRAEQLVFQQALVDTIPYPVFYKDADTRFLGFNRAYELAFAVNRETLIGKRVMDLDHLPEDQRIAYQAEDEAVIASGDSIKREVAMQFADGQMHDNLYFVSGFRRADGAPGGLVGTFIDISALKGAEREMDRMADLERFNRLAHGREQRILELKREVNTLAEACGKVALYATTLIEPVGDHEVPPHPDYRTEVTVARAPLRLDELVDLEEFQTLFSSFCEVIGVPAAIIDLQANVLASSRWQRACTDFHRINPTTCARCIESDTGLALKLQDGEDFSIYQCKNGMTDCASPIIVEGQHLANVFIGQFHLKPPDENFFRAQARTLGFDEEDYWRAILEAPVMDEQRLPVILKFLSGFSRMISTMSLARRRADETQQILRQQATLLQQERTAALSLAEDADKARKALVNLTGEAQP